MERIDFINIRRLQWCCDEVGIDVEALAEQTGISASTLKKLFEGKGGLTYNQLKTLADFFGKGVFFFLEEGDVTQERVHSANFRTLSNQKPYLSLGMRKFIERVERKRDEYLWLLEELEGTQPDFELPELRGSIEEKALQLRRWLELPERNSYESYREAIESKGIFVLQSLGYQGKWKIPKESPVLGFSLWHQKMPVIVVRKETTKERQTFTLIHEFAHLVLHQESRIDDENDLFANNHDVESEANRFAGNLLIPESFLTQIDTRNIPNRFDEYSDWFKSFRKRWGVSTEVILRRLVDTQRVDVVLYRAYRDWLGHQNLPQSSGGHRHRNREPLHIFGTKYVQKVLDAKNFDVITLYKASKFLDGLKINYLHQLEGHLVGNR